MTRIAVLLLPLLFSFSGFGQQLNSRSDLQKEGIKRQAKSCDLGGAEILLQMKVIPVQGGFEVSMIEPNGYWDKAGFKLRDIVTHLNGVEYTSPTQAIMGMEASDGLNHEYEILRGGKKMKLRVPCHTQ